MDICDKPVDTDTEVIKSMAAPVDTHTLFATTPSCKSSNKVIKDTQGRG